MFLRVHVTPDSRRESLRRVGNRFQIAVKDRPLGNLANQRTLSLLGRHLGVPAKQLRIVTGSRSPHKIVLFQPH